MLAFSSELYMRSPVLVASFYLQKPVSSSCDAECDASGRDLGINSSKYCSARRPLNTSVLPYTNTNSADDYRSSRMSTARLSSLSFQTLSLLLERQRLRALGKSALAAQLTTIERNMEVLRAGILELEREAASGNGSGKGREDALRNAEQLRGQWDRAQRMLGEEGKEIEECVLPSSLGFRLAISTSCADSCPTGALYASCLLQFTTLRTSRRP